MLAGGPDELLVILVLLLVAVGALFALRAFFRR